MAETEPRRRKTLVVWDLEGWVAIAAAVERSVRWVQSYSRRADDPLPVSRLGGRIVASSALVKAWLVRQTGLQPV